MSRKSYDWEALEREYRIGIKSLRILSAEFGPSIGAISKRAKREGWAQDKAEEVRQRTRAALLRETPDGNAGVNAGGNAPTRADIERAVATNVEVIREHRSDIRKGRQIVDLLSNQLREAAESRREIEGTIEDEEPDLRRRNAMLKAVALPSHAGVARDLSTALKNLIPLERQAFGLDDDAPAKALEDLIGNLDPASRKRLADALRNE